MNYNSNEAEVFFNSYIILPRFYDSDFDDEIDPIDKIYYHNYISDILRSKHSLFKDVTYKHYDLMDIGYQESNYYPKDSNSLVVLRMFFEKGYEPSTSIRNLKLQLSKSLENISNCEKEYEIKKAQLGLQKKVNPFWRFEKNTIKDIQRVFLNHSNDIREIDEDEPKNKIALLPILESEEELFDFESVKDQFESNLSWFEQIVDFFDFLSRSNYTFSQDILPSDFLMNDRGVIVAFIGYGKLLENVGNQNKIKNSNFNQLRVLVNAIVQQNINIYSKNNPFIKIYNRLNYGGEYENSAIPYTTFEELLEDLGDENKLPRREKNIAVFIDYANIFTGLGKLNLDLRQLLCKVYDEHEYYKIKSKTAVIFEPTYNDEYRNLRSELRTEFVHEYLKKYGFNIITTRNELSHAKEIRGDEEYDVDDTTLIELIKKTYQEFDSICIMSGDKHFTEIAKEIKLSGREVIFISSNKESTSKYISDNYKLYTVDDYIDCFLID